MRTMKCQKGMTLIEVMIAMVLLIIFSAGFIWAFGINYSVLSQGQDVTKETFEFQEMLENKILEYKLKAAEPGYTGGDLEIEVTFNVGSSDITRTVKGESLELEGTDVRFFYTFVSDTQIVTPPAPQVSNVELKAYHPSDLNTETFPWSGSVIFADYDDSDPLIFSYIHRWYRSKSASERNPSFPGGYDLVFELIDDGTGSEIGDQLAQSYTQNNGHYLYYGITPYSIMGKMGRQARNEERILIAAPPVNPYWKDLIENAYLGNLKRLDDDDILVETMLNNEELTLNVEINRSTNLPNGPYVFNPIPSYYHNSNFTMQVGLKMGEDIEHNDDYGFGFFLGDYSGGSGTGYMIELVFTPNPENNVIKLTQIINGNYNGDPQQVNMSEFDMELDFSTSYLVLLTVDRIENKIGIQLKEKDTEESSIQIWSGEISSGITTKYMGLKTWSDYKYKDIDPYGKYGRMFTTHFYDIEFFIAEPVPGTRFNLVSGQNTNIGSNISLANYTVPDGVGSSAVLFVWVQAEHGINSEASNCSFGENPLTKIDDASTLFFANSYNTGVAMFYKNVSAGESGSIVANFSGTAVQNGSIHAVVVSGLDYNSTPEATVISSVNTSNISTALSGLSGNSFIITGGAHNEKRNMNAIGDDHVILTEQLVDGDQSTGAQGFLITNLSSVANIGWSIAGDPVGRAVVSLVAFSIK